MPKISIIVPVYNVEQYLDKCVESILSQTFDDFELILVDDGSPDNCPKMCDEWANKDSRIHVIHQENRGLSAARNAGIDWAFTNSDSEWLTFIDSDDLINCKYLEFLYTAGNNNSTKINVCRFDDCTHFPQENKAYDCRVLNISQAFCNTEYHDFNLISACAKLFKKELFLHIRFPLNKLHEDAFVIPKIEFSCDQVSLIDCKLYSITCNPNSITRTKWHPKRLDEIEAWESLITYFKDINNHNSEKRARYILAKVLLRQNCEIKKDTLTYKRYKKYAKCLKRLYRIQLKFLSFKEILSLYENLYFPKHKRNNIIYTLKVLPNNLLLKVLGEEKYNKFKNKLR